MSDAAPNLVNLEKVSKSYGIRVLLDEVSLGVGEGERIGVVGRNGDGKTTLLNLIAGRLEPDAGRVSQARGLHLGYLDQRDLLDDSHTVREVVLAGKADHEWAADPTTREVVEVLLAGISLERVVHGLSGEIPVTGGKGKPCAAQRAAAGELPASDELIEYVACVSEKFLTFPDGQVDQKVPLQAVLGNVGSTLVIQVAVSCVIIRWDRVG